MGRGASHSKVLLIDDAVGLLTSANVKGSHHRANSFDAPYHDFGSVLAGPVVGGAMRQDIAANVLAANKYGGNANTPTQTTLGILAAMERPKVVLTPFPCKGRWPKPSPKK